MVMLVTIETTTYTCMWTVKNALDVEGIYMVILKNFTEKAKLQTVKLRKLGNGKTPTSKIISTIYDPQLPFL